MSENICKKDEGKQKCVRCGETKERVKRWDLACMLEGKYKPNHEYAS